MGVFLHGFQHCWIFAGVLLVFRLNKLWNNSKCFGAGFLRSYMVNFVLSRRRLGVCSEASKIGKREVATIRLYLLELACLCGINRVWANNSKTTS